MIVNHPYRRRLLRYHSYTLSNNRSGWNDEKVTRGSCSRNWDRFSMKSNSFCHLNLLHELVGGFSVIFNVTLVTFKSHFRE